MASSESIDDLNPIQLPLGFGSLPIYDRRDLVQNTLHTVSRTLLEGLMIVVSCSFCFSAVCAPRCSLRFTIPLSLLFAFICMRLAGIPANLLSLGALDFGIIVDGTLVMVEHIVHRLAKGAGRTKPWWIAVREAALEVERPIFFSLLILISAYLPLFTLERVERRLFTPMAFTVCAALFGSMLLTLTIIPVLATYMFRDRCKGWENPLLSWVYRYEIFCGRLLRKPDQWLHCSSGGRGGIRASPSLGSEFLPQLDEGVIWIRANLPPGTP